MKRLLLFLLPLLLLGAIALWAADFWQTKPFTDWSDKEVQKMTTNSPWARQVSIPIGTAGGGGGGRGGGRRGGGGGGMSGGGMDAGGMSSAGAGGAGGPAGVGGGMEGAGGGRGGMGTTDAGLAPNPSMNFTISWESALPVRQARAKLRWGAEANTSAEAKKALESQDQVYVISVSGLPASMARGGAPRMAEMIKAETFLNRKGKDQLQPEKIQFAPRQEILVAYFFFSRKDPITLEDKDVEFVTKLGQQQVKYRFRLKDMMFGDKLEL